MQEIYPEGQGWNRRVLFALLTVVLLFSQPSCGGSGSDPRREISNEDLAYHWAPVHYQDIHSVAGDQSRADYITRLDRDLEGREGGIWDLEQNWKRDLPFPLRAYVYYSVVTTRTHFFITYSFFHVWDTMVFLGQRLDWETNDLEGVLFVIRRDGGYGELEVVFAQAHGYILTYLTEETFSRFEAKRLRPFPLAWSSQQDRASMGNGLPRVVTTQEQGGHGAGCYPDWGAPSPGNLLVWPHYRDHPHDGGGDHIRYIPGTVAEEPDLFYDIYYDDEGKEKQDPNRFTYCRYKLINVFAPDGGLWYHRDEPKVFTETRRTFIGHSTPLWCWRGDKGTNEGEFVLDGFSLTPEEKAWVVASQHPWTHNPAHLCWAYLRLTNDTDPQTYFSTEYEWNPYLEDLLDGT